MHWDTIRPVLLKAFANTWSTRLLTKVLASTYSWRTQQDKTRVLWIPQNPWLIFEQFKDILVEYPLTLRWWFFSNSLQLDIVYFSQRLFFQHSLYNGERVDMEATKDGRLSSSHHVTLFFAEIPTKKNLLMITQFLKKCTTSHWKRNQDATSLGDELLGRLASPIQNTGIISLDAGLRMDGLLALDLWDIVIEVLRSTNNTARQSELDKGNLCTAGNHSPTDKRKREVEQLSNVDHVPTNTQSSQGESQLYLFWRQWSCHQDDYQRTKSNDETRIQIPQSCAWLVVRQN